MGQAERGLTICKSISHVLKTNQQYGFPAAATEVEVFRG